MEGALEIVRAALGKCAKPYVSFSAGKDSLVALNLVRSIRPDIPAVYFDSGRSFPETLEILDKTGHLIRLETADTFEHFKRVGILSDKADQHKRSARRTKRLADLKETYGFDCAFLGLRAEESRGRRIHLRSHGPLYFCQVDAVWQCNPIWNWLAQDIWAYIDCNNIVYNRYYDINPFEPREKARLADWTININASNGKWVWLKMTHPDLFAEFAREFPEVRAYV